MADEIPVIGPVTVTFQPEHAAELGMVLQHILHNIPDNPRPDQAARAHHLGEAALLLSDAFIRAMQEAGVDPALIERATGRIAASAPEANAAQLALVPDPPEPKPSDGTPEITQSAPDWAADATENPTPDAPVDFPTPGGPPDAA